MPEEMIIFSRTFDMLAWLIPQSEKFPKSQRFVISKRLLDAALNFQESLFDANHAQHLEDRDYFLQEADAYLDKLRLYLRLVFQFKWLSSGQYEHISRMVAEIGRLLGGWIKQTQRG